MSNHVSSNTLNKQLGKFVLDANLIRENPGTCFAILSTVIPIRAEHLYWCDKIEYQAISHSFDVLEAGMIMPEYKAIVEGQFIRWEKQD